MGLKWMSEASNSLSVPGTALVCDDADETVSSRNKNDVSR